MPQKKLSNTIRVCRAEAGLTQQELAAAVGVSRKTINVIEGGNYAPSVALALAIAEALQKTIGDIFFLADE